MATTHVPESENPAEENPRATAPDAAPSSGAHFDSVEGEPSPSARAERMRWGFRQHLEALGIYLLLTVWVFAPLMRNFTTHVTGNGIDDPALAWNLWWVKYSLVDLLNPDIFHVGWMFHPVQINLGFYTLTPLNGLLSIPLQAAFGLVVANNLLLMFSFVLSAYGVYLLARRTLAGMMFQGYGTGEQARFRIAGYQLACLLAGFVYAFAASKIFYANLGQYNIASTQWIPFCVLLIIRMTQADSTRRALLNGLLAGLFLVFQAWSELTYASFLLIFFAYEFAWCVWRVVRRESKGKVVFAGFVSAAAVFVLGIAPFLWAMLPDLRSEGDFFSSAGGSSGGGGFADLFSADLAGYLVPSRLSPLFGDWVATLPIPSQFGQQVFLGYITVALAIVGAVFFWRRHRPTALYWGLATFLFWLLSLGPTVRWMGEDTGIPGPFALVSLLPFFSGNRYPSRYGVVLLLCVAILAAAGVLAIAIWLGRRETGRFASYATSIILLCAILLAVVVEHRSIVWLNDFRIPEIYATLANQPGDKAVLELPTGWRNGARVLGKSDALIMMQQWYQTEHTKRRLGGNTSRNPQHKFQYFTDHPLMGDLIALMNADQAYMTQAVDNELPAMIERHANAAQELADLGVGWVTVQVEKSTPQLLAFVDTLPLTLLEEWQGADWNGEPSTIRLYAASPPAPPSGARTIDLADATGTAFTAQGWSPLSNGAWRAATRPTADLVIPVEPGEMLGFEGTGEATIRLNGEHLAWTNGESFAIAAPAALAVEPVDRLSIQFGGRGSTSIANATPTPIGSTGVSLEAGVWLALRSAAEQVGDFAEIWLTGDNLASSETGYNLAALHANGTLIDTQTFNTFLSEEESARMAEWIAALPAGAVVAGAVADEASYRLTEQGVAALRTLGVATDLRGCFRCSHAFVGVTGAPANSAVESVNVLRPADLWLASAVLGPAVYGAQSELTVSQTPE